MRNKWIYMAIILCSAFCISLDGKFLIICWERIENTQQNIRSHTHIHIAPCTGAEHAQPAPQPNTSLGLSSGSSAVTDDRSCSLASRVAGFPWKPSRRKPPTGRLAVSRADLSRSSITSPPSITPMIMLFWRTWGGKMDWILLITFSSWGEHKYYPEINEQKEISTKLP